jgi:hypothetical protein
MPNLDRCQILIYRLADLIPFLEISHVIAPMLKDVLGISGMSQSNIKNLRDSRDTILLHLDTIPRTSCNIYLILLRFTAMRDL